jgi:hypothetical protein
MKIREVDNILCHFSGCVLILAKNGLGCILGDFFKTHLVTLTGPILHNFVSDENLFG